MPRSSLSRVSRGRASSSRSRSRRGDDLSLLPSPIFALWSPPKRGPACPERTNNQVLYFSRTYARPSHVIGYDFVASNQRSRRRCDLDLPWTIEWPPERFYRRRLAPSPPLPAFQSRLCCDQSYRLWPAKHPGNRYQTPNYLMLFESAA